MKQNLIRTVDLIGKSLHPSHLQTTDFVFQKRGDLLVHMQVLLGTETHLWRDTDYMVFTELHQDGANQRPYCPRDCVSGNECMCHTSVTILYLPVV